MSFGKIGTLRDYHSRTTLVDSLLQRQRRAHLDRRLLFVYKDVDATDHQLYALLNHLRTFAGVSILRFTAAERPRTDPARSTAKLRRAVASFEPQIVLVYNNILSIEEVDFIKERGVRLASMTSGVASFTWGAPPEVTQQQIVDRIRVHDWYFVPHAPHVPILRAEGVNAIELSHWFEPAWFRPLDLPPEHDVLFVGDLDNPLNRGRRALIESLSQQFDVTVMSAGSAPSRVRRLAPTSNPHALNRLLNQAKLVLGSDLLFDTSALNSLPGQYLRYEDTFFIRQRTFMSLGAGACYLVEAHPEATRLFEPGCDIVLWRDQTDLRDDIARLLADHATRKAIGVAGARRAHAEYTTATRIRTMFDYFGVHHGLKLEVDWLKRSSDQTV